MVYYNVFAFVFNGRKEELANGINLSSQANRADYAGAILDAFPDTRVLTSAAYNQQCKT